LGSREEQGSASGKHAYASVSVSDTFQFISLEKLLPKLLECTSLKAMMMEQREICRNTSVISDFMSTQTYQQHDFLLCNQPALVQSALRIVYNFVITF
jgi:hypothetical protein